MFPVALETLPTKCSLILFDLFDGHHDVLCGGRGQRGMNSQLLLLFLTLSWSIHFSRLTFYNNNNNNNNLQPACLTCTGTVHAGWKPKCGLNPVPSPSTLPELGSLLSSIHYYFLCILSCFLSPFLFYHFFHACFLWKCWGQQSQFMKYQYNEQLDRERAYSQHGALIIFVLFGC